MHKKLEEIIQKTKQELILRKKETSLKKLNQIILQTAVHSQFFNNLKNLEKLGLIAEIKIASPIDGLIIPEDTDIEKRILSYKNAGADAISIITERNFFLGDYSLVPIAKGLSNLPILQKDFVIDPYQIYESKSLGADALLLIARLVDKDQLVAFVDICHEIGLDPVVEINSLEDLEKAYQTNTPTIAVNARDLNTFKMDINKACELLKLIPAKYLKLGFSAIESKKDAQKYRSSGADAVLIGTALMKTDNPQKLIKEVIKND